MRDILKPAVDWWQSGYRFAMATVVRTERSALRPPGSAMVVGPDDSVAGSISAGCVEANVYDQAKEVRANGRATLLRIGASDADADGLTCGGALDVLIERVDQTTFPELSKVAELVAEGTALAVARRLPHVDGTDPKPHRLVIWPAGSVGSLGSAREDAEIIRRVRTSFDQNRGGWLAGGVFVSMLDSPARLLVFGMSAFAVALTELGATLGYRVTVCDARAAFLLPARFPAAHEVVVDWPHRYLDRAADSLDKRTAICVLTHDTKFDVPALVRALRLPVGYVGALGSRRLHTDRLNQLRAAGVTTAQLATLHSPIGLDLGGNTPAETALSIAAELVARRNSGTGVALSTLTGPIHQRRDQPHDGRLAMDNMSQAGTELSNSPPVANSQRQLEPAPVQQVGPIHALLTEKT